MRACLNKPGQFGSWVLPVDGGPQRLSDVFLSYARADRLRVKPLADALQKKGWSVWWDPTIRAGEIFDKVIERALADAQCVIVLWSRNSIESD
jgi:hypothetical protein